MTKKQLFLAVAMGSLFLTNSYAKTICSPDDRVTLKESGFPETQIVKMCDKPNYPVIGSREGYIDKIAETDLPKLATSSYPTWYRGTGPNGSYNDDSTYWGRWMVGPKEWVQSGLVANKIAAGTMVLKPNAKYPVHNHPTWELYVVLEGNGIFVKNERRYDIVPGDFLITRPYDPHAVKNMSDSKPLKFVWIWWQEGDVGFDIMNAGGQPINPVECWKDQESACMSPVPIPPPLTGKDADKYLYDPTIPTPPQ